MEEGMIESVSTRSWTDFLMDIPATISKISRAHHFVALHKRAYSEHLIHIYTRHRQEVGVSDIG